MSKLIKTNNNFTGSNDIDASPHVLHNLISEYNMEHRSKMKKILRELTNYQSYTLICEGCNIGKIGTALYSVIAEDFVCSKKCLENYVSLLPDGYPLKHAYDDLL